MAEHELGADNIDNLARMLMALLTEHWVLRDRFAILEALMIERGALASGEIDDYIPPPALAAELETLRDRTAAAVIGAPLSAQARGVDDILARAGLARPA